MGAATIGTIITALAGLVGVLYTAWNARRTKIDEVSRPQWSEFTDKLQRQLKDQGRAIDDLYQQVHQLRTDLRAEQRRGDHLLAYLRRVLTWARVHTDAVPPEPPETLWDDVADVWRR